MKTDKKSPTTPDDLILRAYFGEKVPKRAVATAIRQLELHGEAFDGGSVTELDAAVASVLLRSVAGHLPQWAMVGEGHVALGRKNSPRTRPKRYRPKHLFTLNWADSGPGLSWPMAYYATPVLAHKRVVVTASADGTDAYGFTDFAVGSFDGKRDRLDGAREVIVNHWGEQAAVGQRRWAYLFTEALVSSELAEQWADLAWGPERDEEDLEDSDV